DPGRAIHAEEARRTRSQALFFAETITKTLMFTWWIASLPLARSRFAYQSPKQGGWLAMLSFRRSFSMPEIGVHYTVHDFAHPSFRVRAEHGKGISADEALMFPNVAWSGYGDRPRIDVILRGEARDVENGVTRWLSRGDFAIGRALDSLYMRTQGEELLCLS